MSSEKYEIQVTPNFLWNTCEVGQATLASYRIVGDKVFEPMSGMDHHYWQTYIRNLFESLEESGNFRPQMLLSGTMGALPTSDEVLDMENDVISSFSVPENYVIEYIRVLGRIAAIQIDEGNDVTPIISVIEHLRDNIDSNQIVDESDDVIKFINNEQSDSLVESFKDWFNSRGNN